MVIRFNKISEFLFQVSESERISIGYIEKSRDLVDNYDNKSHYESFLTKKEYGCFISIHGTYTYLI